MTKKLPDQDNNVACRPNWCSQEKVRGNEGVTGEGHCYFWRSALAAPCRRVSLAQRHTYTEYPQWSISSTVGRPSVTISLATLINSGGKLNYLRRARYCLCHVSKSVAFDMRSENKCTGNTPGFLPKMATIITAKSSVYYRDLQS